MGPGAPWRPCLYGYDHIPLSFMLQLGAAAARLLIALWFMLQVQIWI